MLLGYIERLVEEKHELDIKIGKAEKFLENKKDMLDLNQIELLENQLKHMIPYSNILKMRIEYEMDKNCDH